MAGGLSPAISSATKMPWAKPRWASCRPGTMSPTANTPVDVGAAALVGQDVAAVHRHARLLVTQAGGRPGPRPTATSSRSASMVSPDSRETVTTSPCLLGAGEAGAGAEADLPLAEGALELLGDGLVLGRHQPGERLDDRDLGAEGLEDRGELDADHAAAQDHDAWRHGVQGQRLLAGHDPAGDLQAGQALGVGTGGQHDVAPDQPATARPRRCWPPRAGPRPRRSRSGGTSPGPAAPCGAGRRRRPCSG